jgi:PDZ domain
MRVVVLTLVAIGAAYSPFKLEAQNSRSTAVDAGPRARTPDPSPSAAQGHIGIELSDVPSTQAGIAHGAGALVRRVQLGSPAAQAGVRVNDVITALNGTPIARANDVKAAMAHLAPGSTAELQILREGQPLSITVNVVAAGPSTYSGELLSTARATSQNGGLSSDTNDSGAELLVAGKPPLTGEMVNKGVRLFEWLLDAHLTIEQRSLFRNCLVGIWNTHRQADIDDAAKALNFQDQVSSKSPEERAVIREALSEKFVASARQKPNDVFAQWMLNIYDSAHRPIASGNPPLTAQVADAYAEFVSFVLRECLGRSAFNPDRNFKNALVHGLAAQYTSYSPEQQRQFAQMPLLWELLRLRWSQLSEAERNKYRQQWRPAVNSLLSGITGGSSTRETAASENSSVVPHSLSDEHLFVQSMANSSFATTMSLHLSMWH